ncbi:hypothetical protein GW17_00008528 [Ensete ventricosum]|nr:hypothetical protein GW17_00008528 [Ensete ventricosum]
MATICHRQPIHLGHPKHPLRLGNLSHRVTSSDKKTLAARFTHAASTLGCMGGCCHGRELATLGPAAFGRAVGQQ